MIYNYKQPLKFKHITCKEFFEKKDYNINLIILDFWKYRFVFIIIASRLCYHLKKKAFYSYLC